MLGPVREPFNASGDCGNVMMVMIVVVVIVVVVVWLLPVRSTLVTLLKWDMTVLFWPSAPE